MTRRRCWSPSNAPRSLRALKVAQPGPAGATKHTHTRGDLLETPDVECLWRQNLTTVLDCVMSAGKTQMKLTKLQNEQRRNFDNNSCEAKLVR